MLHNVDLTVTLTAELIQVIRDALLERKVIFFRDQHLSEDQQTAFGRQFGGLDAFPFGTPGDNPFILKDFARPRQPRYRKRLAHRCDLDGAPSLGSIAQCVVTPPYGGDTLFSDSHAAYLGLPTALRERIDHLSGINDYRIFIQGRGRGAMPDDLVTAVKERIPFGVSTSARAHPSRNRQAGALSPRWVPPPRVVVRPAYRPNARANDSKQIVTTLLAQHGRPEYICRFPWKADSIAFWDNRAVQHYAASDYYPHKRVLRRVTISGDRPYNNLD